MEKEITVLIGEQDDRLRADLKRAIMEKDLYRVVGETATAAELLRQANESFPDVVIADQTFWRTAEAIAKTGDTKVIILADEPKDDLWRLCLRAGISDLLPRNVTRDQLQGAITAVIMPQRKGNLPGKTIAIFSTKGGVGKTTLAVNLAVAFGSRMAERIAIWDLDLEFGNAAAFFGVKPRETIADLVGRPSRSQLSQGKESQEMVTWEIIEKTLAHPGGYPVDLLAPPPAPEMAEVVENSLSGGVSAKLLAELKKHYPIVILDLPSNFRETTLSALDQADTILILTGPDIPSLYNTSKGLDVLLNRLGYSKEKVLLGLNRSDAAMSLSQEDIAKALNHPISFTLPSDGVLAVTAANTGQPFMRRRSRGYLSEAVGSLADSLIGKKPSEPNGKQKVLWVF